MNLLTDILRNEIELSSSEIRRIQSLIPPRAAVWAFLFWTAHAISLCVAFDTARESISYIAADINRLWLGPVSPASFERELIALSQAGVFAYLPVLSLLIPAAAPMLFRSRLCGLLSIIPMWVLALMVYVLVYILVCHAWGYDW